MKLKLKNETIELYDSIKTIPIKRKHEFEKALLVLSGIGGSLEEYDQHANKVFLFLDKGSPDQVKQELLNQRQQFYFLISNFSPLVFAFVWLVKSWDIKSTEEAQEKHNHLLKLGITTEQAQDLIADVKKNYLQN